ncbi:biopolymer transporter ExbD [uncultured Oxalobacter sp.]|uniref:ExbD/TolR family protein n=1 Tax=uncultured Oxalobacter sp. TaxID=337245 RepID=UPI00259A879E|nr:biopolymer transporter ExbD [uncultured Oxalobacter sp.]
MAFGGGLNDQEDVMSEINVTPLVDVMLVLLVIFILTVPVLTHSVKVDLPQTQKLNTAVDPKSISISVASDGSVYWNGKRIDNAQLETMLAEVAAQEQQAEIRLYGDRRVAYEEVVKIMAAAQRAGIEKLGFVTQPQP